MTDIRVGSEAWLRIDALRGVSNNLHLELRKADERREELVAELRTLDERRARITDDIEALQATKEYIAR